MSIYFSADNDYGAYLPGDSTYVVTAYAGDASGLRAAVKAARKHFKDAMISTIKATEEGLSFDLSLLGHCWIIILGSERDYQQALAHAKDISMKTGIPFSTRDHIYDKDHDELVWPGENADDPYAGIYFARRYNSECDEGQSECITIEMSSYYDNFSPAFFMIVGGIYGDQKQANTKLRELRKTVPDAYIKDTFLYFGCRL